MPLSQLLEPEPRKRHAYKYATPHVSYDFMFAANPFRMRRRAANDSFADTGRTNAFNTPKFFPVILD